MSINMYIGLHKTTPHRALAGYWHWKIIIPNESFHNPVDSYSVAEDDDGRQPTHKLSLYNGSIQLQTCGTFFALVRLPPVNAPEHDIQKFLLNQSAEQSDTPLIPERGEWSCAQWVIRALQEMESFGWFSVAPTGNLSDRTAYYNYIRRSKGVMCEAALSNGSTSPDFIGEVVDGARVLD